MEILMEKAIEALKELQGCKCKNSNKRFEYYDTLYGDIDERDYKYYTYLNDLELEEHISIAEVTVNDEIANEDAVVMYYISSEFDNFYIDTADILAGRQNKIECLIARLENPNPSKILFGKGTKGN